MKSALQKITCFIEFDHCPMYNAGIMLLLNVLQLLQVSSLHPFHAFFVFSYTIQSMKRKGGSNWSISLKFANKKFK